ncbi:sterol desaturase/sphingolipid hydroxylase (fatty acid hydroxylase superfamily) [Methylobacterium brachiatum]|jgi:sterol desaturase/sphingolipid hydroxylase (fatty acid hydroxylase superfamily)|uniref:Sterol desaturase/sphingolipid hydroxylase (Fatty acid hydroxylase superfamily) n=1 Tax=Methylobacterium brachiatum TaxID=269660 RepID=A0AAJ1TKK1_9HYPH|nr:sterol desaturase family protein [Methylobacterium brachiatum]MCB4802012.1 sterol desaturase family protein [Methylobacterium brachiatum]MDQ0542351.1 sterol desaturase/sphingolipid hydroxylase (fatty acid hydroxylase superfamily) [Methylobacterium brachiatum]
MEYVLKLFMEIHPFFLTWGVFFFGGLAFIVFQAFGSDVRINLKEIKENFLPFNPISSASVKTDMVIYLFRKFTDVVFSMPGLAVFTLIASQSERVITIFVGFSPNLSATQFSAFSCTCVMILAVEFSEYVVHYLEHKVPFLWELHKVHHSAEHMTPLTTKREHSFLQFASGLTGGVIKGIPAGIIMFLYGFSLGETLVLSIVANRILLVWTLDPLKHSHIPIGLGWFDKIFISPHMHQIHHSKTQAHWDRNFGTNLSIFDWAFGTAYKPLKGEKAVFGISGYSDASLQKFNTIHGAFINPIKRSYKRIAKHFPSAEAPKTETVKP